MDRLFLIDHSLRDTGGHHFDYVRSIADAARQSGRSVTIGCHRKLAKANRLADQELVTALQQLGDVRPVFHETVYQDVSWLAGLQKSKRLKRPPKTKLGANLRKNTALWLSPIRQLLARRRRARLIKLFAAGCRDFFDGSSVPQSGDQVLIAAASELELLGAIDFLVAEPRVLKAKWHFLFHFNLFDGWTPEYESHRVAMMRTRGSLLDAIQKLPAGSVRFHATTETLADQFNFLGAARFDPLPYPVSSDCLSFQESDRQKEDRPARNESAAVRLVCAGAIRREKGQVAQLQGLVDQIKKPLLLNRKAKLLIQRPKQKRLGRQKLELSLGETVASDAVPGAIEYLDHPLPRNEYRQLLGSADVGLFCYDARSYFSRCAGILVEMLACGKPVVVPAGTWLADQVQQPIQRHVTSFQREHRSEYSIEHSDFQFDHSNVPGPGGVWSFDEGAHSFNAKVECESADEIAVVGFDWHWPRQHGLYARVECVQRDQDGVIVSKTAQVVGAPRGTASPRLMFRLQHRCKSLEFRLTNAFAAGAMTVRNFSMWVYGGEGLATKTALGAVGVIAASPAELPQCVDEVVKHIDHYQRSANVFANDWLNRHHPQRTVDRIFDRRTLSARVA